MQKRFRRQVRVGIFFAAGGALAAVGGFVGLLSFLSNPSDASQMTPLQLAKEIIVPHVFMWAGLGIIMYGVITIVSAMILNVRTSALDEPDEWKE